MKSTLHVSMDIMHVNPTKYNFESLYSIVLFHDFDIILRFFLYVGIREVYELYANK